MGLVMVESVLLSFKRFRKKRFIEFLELNVAPYCRNIMFQFFRNFQTQCCFSTDRSIIIAFVFVIPNSR